MRKEWGFVKVFGVFCGFFEAPPGVLGVSTAGLLWGGKSREGSSGRTGIKGFFPPWVQKGGFELFEVHSDERYFEFCPSPTSKKN